MIFILRDKTGRIPPADIKVELTRSTPDYADAGDGVDFFCTASVESFNHLNEQGYCVVALKDGWYEAGDGGIAIWGGGKHWEIRDTLFTVRKQ